MEEKDTKPEAVRQRKKRLREKLLVSGWLIERPGAEGEPLFFLKDN